MYCISTASVRSDVRVFVVTDYVGRGADVKPLPPSEGTHILAAEIRERETRRPEVAGRFFF